MSKNVTVWWDLPTIRSNNEPQDPAGLSHTKVSFSADLGSTFVPLADVPSTDLPQEVFIPDLVDGDYIIRLAIVDILDLVGGNVDTPFKVDSSVPGLVQNVFVEFS